MTDMNKLLRAQFRGEGRESQAGQADEEESETESVGGKSDGGAGGNAEHGPEQTNMNTLIREAMFGR